MDGITESAMLVRAFDATMASANGETFIVRGRDAYRVNATGAKYWSAFEGQLTMGDLATEVASQTGEDLGRVTRDAIRFGAELLRRGLVERVE